MRNTAGCDKVTIALNYRTIFYRFYLRKQSYLFVSNESNTFSLKS